jgi:hypothetical protein
MREKFEDRRLTGQINVACKYDDGTVRYWTTTKEEVVEHIVQIVEEYEAEGYVLTLRQLHYQLVSNNWIVNHDTAYKKLGDILDDCRYAGIIDWEAVEDRGRVPHLLYQVDSVTEALEDTVEQYRRNRQEGQEKEVELWTEKDALSGILKRTTEKYQIRLVVNKGYTSSSAIYRAYQRVLKTILYGRQFVILYFGDHDPSGLDMVRDISDRLFFMLSNGRYSSTFEDSGIDLSEALRIVPIGLTKKQINQYNLPPNPTKLTDSRAKKYISKHGRTCWEVDALKPQTLTAIVESHIQNEIDMDLYNLMMETEAADIENLRGIIDGLDKE